MRKARLSKINGQSLIEILIGIAVGVIIIGGVTATIALTLRSNVQNKNIQTATSLSQELLDKLTDFAGANWHNIDALSGPHHLQPAGATFAAVAGSENVIVEGITFSRSFTTQNVSRDPGTDTIESIYNPGNDDPSTKKAVVLVTWQVGADTAQASLNKFLTRSKNLIFHQTDWSGSAGQAGPITVPNNRYDSKSNIDTAGVAGSLKVQGY